MSEIIGPVSGTVAAWNAADGWGVLRSPDAPADIWCPFSAILGGGYRELTPGEPVTFTYYAVAQDGYDYAAEEIRQDTAPGAAGIEFSQRRPVAPESRAALLARADGRIAPGGTAAYSSRLTITLDKDRPRP